MNERTAHSTLTVSNLFQLIYSAIQIQMSVIFSTFL